MLFLSKLFMQLREIAQFLNLRRRFCFNLFHIRRNHVNARYFYKNLKEPPRNPLSKPTRMNWKEGNKLYTLIIPKIIKNDDKDIFDNIVIDAIKVFNETLNMAKRVGGESGFLQRCLVFYERKI